MSIYTVAGPGEGRKINYGEAKVAAYLLLMCKGYGGLASPFPQNISEMDIFSYTKPSILNSQFMDDALRSLRPGLQLLL